MFPIGQAALKLLRNSVGDRKEGYVFINPKTGTRYNSIHKTFNRAVRELNLQVYGTKLRFHELRHIFATWLHRAGVSLDVLRPLMVHRDRATTDRYTTIDRLEAGKVLRVMPRIKRSGHITSSTDEAQLNSKEQKWQELARTVDFLATGKLVSS